MTTRAWNQPHATPEVAWSEIRCGYKVQRFVTITGQEFSIHLTPNMAIELSDQLRRSAHKAILADDHSARQITDLRQGDT